VIGNPHAFRAFRDRWLTRRDELRRLYALLQNTDARQTAALDEKMPLTASPSLRKKTASCGKRTPGYGRKTSAWPVWARSTRGLTKKPTMTNATRYKKAERIRQPANKTSK
jgi:hypothetical protein